MARKLALLLLMTTGCDRAPIDPRCLAPASDDEKAWVLKCITADAAPAGSDDAFLCRGAALGLFRGC